MLTHVSIGGNTVPPEVRAAVGGALGQLAVARALTSLDASYCELGAEGLIPLLGGFARPALQRAALGGNPVVAERRSAVGAALGRMVAAGAHTLTFLDVSSCLGDDGVRSLVVALPGSTRLRALDIAYNALTQNASPWVLAAVQANTSLRTLSAISEIFIMGPQPPPDDALAQAEALVAARPPA